MIDSDIVLKMNDDVETKHAEGNESLSGEPGSTAPKYNKYNALFRNKVQFYSSLRCKS